MSACLDEGTLLAHLDGQLAEEAGSVTEHLLTCGRCQLALERLRSMATEVDACLDVLGEVVEGLPIVPTDVDRTTRRICAVLLATAAAVLFLIAEIRNSRAEPQINAFLALEDNEPIQIGTVVRLKLPASVFDPTTATDSAMVDSEVILGDDGAPRAVRLLKGNEENKK